MLAVDVIAKKRDGQVLSEEEIRWFIDAYTRDELPDYQAAAFCMAIAIRGMNAQETTALTLAMVDSGEKLDLSDISDYVVDKHSSGGVGDKTTLVVQPLVAACGVPVAKMSGRGLGYTGGTLDKMESIAGFNVNLTDDEFYAQAKAIGLVLVGQSHDLAPADGKLYALRDVTATVPSIPLIAASIMSKKIAAGAHGIVLDVKVGSGAFMATVAEAKELAKTMVDIGRLVKRDVIALISDMNQPLGFAVGNAIEVKEAIQTMHGAGPQDFREHCLDVAAHMLHLVGYRSEWKDFVQTKTYLGEQLSQGVALEKFRQMVQAQGGDVSMVDDPSKLPEATIIETLQAEHSGYIEQVAADKIARAAFELGAGRLKKGDAIDFAVGLEVHVKVGDKIQKGDKIATIHANDAGNVPFARGTIKQAIAYSDQPVAKLPLFYDVLGTQD